MAAVVDDGQFLDYKRRFQRFLTEDDDPMDAYSNIYKVKVEAMMESRDYRLTVSLNDLRSYDGELATLLLKKPLEMLPPLEEAVRDVVVDIDPSYCVRPGVGVHAQTSTSSPIPIHVSVEGSFGSHHVNPRTLRAPYLCKLVCVEGIVTKCSLVRPKVVHSVHFCPRTKMFLSRQYRDATSISSELPTSSVYPTMDENGNPLETEFGLSTYKDHQTITIQEMPETAPLGQLPRSVDVILDNDLVDSAKPGDRVLVVGIFRALARGGGAHSSLFRTVIIANNVRTIGKEVHGLVMTPNDIRNIRAVSKRSDSFDLLARSLAPSIYGHEFIKQAVLLQLLGGVEKNLDNGTHLRGDINILLVGDPSTAKSQMLRFVLRTAPLAINTTGRGSSGVGLTAAVVTDKDTGERRLEAGAMVLADRGVVCIDEFDKMSDTDRVAIHEIMEQQTVTIAKAGIHASLNARCSVLAAANPIYGAYDKSKDAQRNVGLPDSLLSRFDLLFIVLDTLDASKDRAIADHVLRLHRYQRPGTRAAEPIPLNAMVRGGGAIDVGGGDDDDDEESKRETPVYLKFNPLLHGALLHSQKEKLRKEALKKAAKNRSKGRRGRGRDRAAGGGCGEITLTKEQLELLDTEFIKKYIHFAKNRVTPKLTEEARECISERYAEMRRDSETKKTLPVTARLLETIIRLSTAHAKARLSKVVTEDDCRVALGIMHYALYNEAAPLEMSTQAKEQREEDAEDEDEDEDSDEDEDDENEHKNEDGKRQRDSNRKRKRAQGKAGDKDKSREKKRKSDAASSGESGDRAENEEEEQDDDGDEFEYEEADETSVRFVFFREHMVKMRGQNMDADSMTLKEVLTSVNKRIKEVSRGLGAASRDTEAYKAAKEGLARDEGKGQGKARAIYSAGEAKSILRGLENANRVMYSMKDSTIHFI